MEESPTKSAANRPFFLLILAIGIVFLYWYPLQIINAIGGFDATTGVFVGTSGTQQIFAFTIVSALVSFGLMTRWILKHESPNLKHAAVALLVSYIATISTTMWYEQVYANLWDSANRSSYWSTFYYSNPFKLTLVVVDMGLLFVAYPWFSRSNLKLVVLFSILTLVMFFAWFATGFQFPTDSAEAYFFNASSRLFSQIAVAVSVIPSNVTNRRGTYGKQ